MTESELKVVCIIFGIQPSSTVRAIGREAVVRENFVKWTTINLKKEFHILNNKKSLRYLRALIRPILIPVNLVQNLKRLHTADIVYVIKYPPMWLSLFLRRLCSIIIYDFDDPMWLNEFAGEKHFNRLLRNYNAFTCDNEIQFLKGQRANPVGKVVDGALPNFDRAETARCNRVNLIWVGSQSTKMYLNSIADVLTQILESRDFVSLKILGVEESDIQAVNSQVTYVSRYDENQMQIELSDSDIGLFPVLGDELSNARGVHKANIYLAAGIPVIASPSLLIENTLSSGLTGYICKSKEDWTFSILSLADHELALLKMKDYIKSEFIAKEKNIKSALELIKFFNEVAQISKSE